MARQLTSPDDRRAARLALVIAQARRRWGDHILRLGRELDAFPLADARPPLSTGSLGLDLLTRGLPRGALTELAGVDGSGVETLSYTALTRCQQDGGVALLLDAGTLSDPAALAAVGVDHRALLLAYPATAAEAWSVLDLLARSDTVDLMVTSLVGLTNAPGASPPLLRQGLRRVAGALRGRATALVVVSVPWPPRLPSAGDAPLLTTAGGPTIAQLAALRVALEPTAPRLTPYGDVAALGARATVVKHHGLPRGPALPLETTERGVHRALELVDLGLRTGVVAESALGLALDGVVLGRTRLRAADALEAAPALAALAEEQIRARWSPAPRGHVDAPAGSGVA